MFEHQTLINQLGDNYTNDTFKRIYDFAYMDPSVITKLIEREDLLSEEWGQNLYVLKKYLSICIPWSIEQHRYTHSHNQLYVTAGHLQTRYGTPLYLVFEQNTQDNQPWRLEYAGSQITAPNFPPAPDIPQPPEIPLGNEVVMKHGHILSDNSERVPFLADTPPVAQICAISGAIQWSLNRGLQVPYWYYGTMQYIVPLYLQNRENIALAPDLVAPIQVNPDNLLVRTILLPESRYPNARVAVRRHDQLPPWLLNAWVNSDQSEENYGDE